MRASIVDTNVFSELAKAKPNDTAVKWLRDHEADLYISSITTSEIRRGIEKLPAGKRKTRSAQRPRVSTPRQ